MAPPLNGRGHFHAGVTDWRQVESIRILAGSREAVPELEGLAWASAAVQHYLSSCRVPGSLLPAADVHKRLAAQYGRSQYRLHPPFLGHRHQVESPMRRCSPVLLGGIESSVHGGLPGCVTPLVRMRYGRSAVHHCPPKVDLGRRSPPSGGRGPAGRLLTEITGGAFVWLGKLVRSSPFGDTLESVAHYGHTRLAAPAARSSNLPRESRSPAAAGTEGSRQGMRPAGPFPPLGTARLRPPGSVDAVVAADRRR